MRRNTIGLISAAVLVCLLASAVYAAAGYDLSWTILAGGGGRAQAGIYTLDSTIGQPVAGFSLAGSKELCSGFWCGVENWIKVFLPSISR
jgi:hypothetical protein